MDGTVLVADDDRTIRTVLTQALTRAGCKVHATGSLVTLMRWVEEGKGELVISDVKMPDGNGLDLLPRIAEQRPNLPVIVISAQNTIMTAIQATEKEAFDYLPKPFDLPDLMKRCATALETKRRAPAPQSSPLDLQDDLPLVGRTPEMQDLYRLVARVMNADIPVLITGESGTGKSLIARAIHDYSDRRHLPFLVATMSDFRDSDSATSVLPRAANGTLLLDEISDFDADAQARVVRMLDSLPQNAPRIIASSQHDVKSLTESDAMRADLFYRLGGVSIEVPSLRERVEDVTLLAEHFLARAERENLPERHFTDEALSFIRSYSWPGNVRQLESLIRRLVVVSQEPMITLAEVSDALGRDPDIRTVQSPEADKLGESVAKHLRRYFDLHGKMLPPAGLYPRILREIELPMLEIALEATGGNQAKCADLLGINRNTLRKKITELDISVTRRRKLM